MKLEKGRKSAILWTEKIIICTLSLILLGMGCGINLVTNQGADPITVFYDGLTKVSGITAGQVATILNGSLILLVLVFDFFDARKKAKANKENIKFLDVFKHIHIGTIIYLVILGFFIDFGIWVYGLLSIPDVMVWGLLNVSQIVASLVGCAFCFVGLGGFMAVNIGIDPWTAAAVILSDETKKSFGLVKTILDALTLLAGWLMGGTVGIITLFCAFAGGPIIQKSYEILDKVLKKVLKSN